MNDIFVDAPALGEPGAWDPPTPAALLADQLLNEHAALAAADEALVAATHVRAVILGRERAARAALSESMALENLTRVERPRGTIVEISARISAKPDATGERPVIALASLRVLPRRPVEDPLFVAREVVAPASPVLGPSVVSMREEDAPASVRRRIA